MFRKSGLSFKYQTIIFSLGVIMIFSRNFKELRNIYITTTYTISIYTNIIISNRTGFATIVSSLGPILENTDEYKRKNNEKFCKVCVIITS